MIPINEQNFTLSLDERRKVADSYCKWIQRYFIDQNLPPLRSEKVKVEKRSTPMNSLVAGLSVTFAEPVAFGSIEIRYTVPLTRSTGELSSFYPSFTLYILSQATGGFTRRLFTDMAKIIGSGYNMAANTFSCYLDFETVNPDSLQGNELASCLLLRSMAHHFRDYNIQLKAEKAGKVQQKISASPKLKRR